MLPVAASLSLLFLWGVGVCLHVGRVGFMPLDQSIVFDGAWRLLSGQVPFREFTTPDSITPIVLQVLFFKAFGVNWFAFCLHAAIFNGLFCLLVYALLRAIRAGMLPALFYAALSGIVFYPPFGTPYRDQHAFFFVMLAIWMAVLAARRPPGWKTDLLWLGVPAALALAYLSKQIPSVFAVPLILLYAALRNPGRTVRSLLWMGFGSILVCVALWGLACVFRVEWGLIRVYFFELPGSTGAGRVENLSHAVLGLMFSGNALSPWKDPGSALPIVSGLLVPALYALVAGRFRRRETFRIILLLSGTATLLVLAMDSFALGFVFGNRLPFHPMALGLIAVTGSGVAVAFCRGTIVEQLRQGLRDFLPEMILAVGMAWTCLLTALLTYHAYENALALVYGALGIAQAYLARLAGLVQSGWASRGRDRPARRCLLRVVPWSLAALAAIQAVNFHRHVNVSRTVHGLQDRPSGKTAGSIVSPALAFLCWDVPLFVSDGLSAQEHAGKVRDLLEFLRDYEGNFLLVGDSSILYALAGRPSVLPSLWFHPGLTIPPVESAEFERFERHLMDNMNRYRVRFLILEGARTWNGASLSSFPGLSRFADDHRFGMLRFGPFTVVDLSGTS